MAVYLAALDYGDTVLAMDFEVLRADLDLSDEELRTLRESDVIG